MIGCKICGKNEMERSIRYSESNDCYLCNGCYGNYDDKEIREKLEK